jgi:hypothetical protein
MCWLSLCPSKFYKTTFMPFWVVNKLPCCSSCLAFSNASFLCLFYKIFWFLRSRLCKRTSRCAFFFCCTLKSSNCSAVPSKDLFMTYLLSSYRSLKRISASTKKDYIHIWRWGITYIICVWIWDSCKYFRWTYLKHLHQASPPNSLTHSTFYLI